MKNKTKLAISCIAIMLGGLNTASAEEKSFTDFMEEDAAWNCKISNDTFELVLIDMEKGTYNHTIKHNGHDVCTSDSHISECNEDYIDTPYYYYKRGKMVDNSGGNRLYRLCAIDALDVPNGRDDKKDEQAEYEAKGGVRW